MNTLFKGITAILPDEESGFSTKVCDIAVSDSVISYIGDDAVGNGFVPDRTIDGRDKLITAGLVNSHTHSYMSLFGRPYVPHLAVRQDNADGGQADRRGYVLRHTACLP